MTFLHYLLNNLSFFIASYQIGYCNENVVGFPHTHMSLRIVLLIPSIQHIKSSLRPQKIAFAYRSFPTSYMHDLFLSFIYTHAQAPLTEKQFQHEQKNICEGTLAVLPSSLQHRYSSSRSQNKLTTTYQ